MIFLLGMFIGIFFGIFITLAVLEDREDDEL
jgi:hypothetical protein